MEYVLELEQRLFKPLADNHQALYFVCYLFDKICDIEIVIIIYLPKLLILEKYHKFFIRTYQKAPIVQHYISTK